MMGRHVLNSGARRILVVSLLALGGAAGNASAMGTEMVGNTALPATDYADWEGIMPIVNHESRVYQVWVNGNEHLHYRGDAKTLNDVLTTFAAAKGVRRNVVLLPGPGKTKTFKKEPVPYDWDLHLVGGIARASLEGNTEVWNDQPTITILVGGGNVELGDLKIPDALNVSELADLRVRYRKALQSEVPHSRGDAAVLLGQLDADHPENVPEIARLLNDKDAWVRGMAAAALGQFGHSADTTLPTLKAGLNDDNEAIRKIFAETIAKIENAEAIDPAAVSRRKETAARIRAFVQARRSEARPPDSDGQNPATTLARDLEAAKATNPEMLIDPDVGVGPIRFGMAVEELKAAVGEPFRITGRAYEYQKLGLAVMLGKDDRVNAILCGAWCEASDVLLDVFKGATKDGIRLRTTPDQVIAVYGRPIETSHLATGFDVLRYDRMRFAFRDGRLVHMTFQRPRPDEPKATE